MSEKTPHANKLNQSELKELYQAGPNAAFEDELGAEEYARYQAWVRKNHGSVTENKNGRVVLRSGDGRFRKLESDQEYRNRVYNEDSAGVDGYENDSENTSEYDVSVEEPDSDSAHALESEPEIISDNTFSFANRKSIKSSKAFTNRSLEDEPTQDGPNSRQGKGRPWSPSPQPEVQYWSAGNITPTDPNRIPYVPTKEPVQDMKPEKKEKSGRRFGKLMRLGAAALFGATLALGIGAQDGDHAVSHRDSTPAGETPTEQTMPSISHESTTEYTIAEKPSVGSEEINAMPESLDAVEDSEESTPTSTGEGVESIEAPDSEAMLPVIEPVVTEANEEDATQIESLEPIVMTETESPEQVIEPGQGEAEATPEEYENLMADVHVAPGDGITHVLAKVLAQAGYTEVSSDPYQLYELYEELVTNPEIGPKNIFEGLTIYYDGVYKIKEKDIDTHATQATANWIQSNYLNR